MFYRINLIGLFSRLYGFYWFSAKKFFYGNCLNIVVKFFWVSFIIVFIIALFRASYRKCLLKSPNVDDGHAVLFASKIFSEFLGKLDVYGL